MKPLPFTVGILTAFIFNAFALSQTPTTKPNGAVPLSPKDVQVLPFCREFKEQKLKATERAIPDELHVNFGDGTIHLYGKKRLDAAPRYQGRPIGHVGKVVILPSADRAGKLTTKTSSAEDSTTYLAVIELDNALEAKPVKLEADKTYDWSIKSEGGNTVFHLSDGAADVANFSRPSGEFKGAGFAATVRFKGNDADLTITTR